MLTIVMTTYFPAGDGGESRGTGAERCLAHFVQHLCSPLPIRLCVADDGSYYINYIDRLVIEAEAVWQTHSLYTNAERGGIGRSLNRALDAIPLDDLILYTTDDWLLTNDLDITPAVLLIRDGYDYVRLGPIHPNLSCITKFNTSIGWWLHLNLGYGYVFATRPFIASRKFFDKVGRFPEGLNAYETERIYTERVNNIGDSISCAQIGAISLPGPWEHIGSFEVGTLSV